MKARIVTSKDISNIDLNSLPDDLPILLIQPNNDGTINGEYINKINPENNFKFENAIIADNNGMQYHV